MRVYQFRHLGRGGESYGGLRALSTSGGACAPISHLTMTAVRLAMGVARSALLGAAASVRPEGEDKVAAPRGDLPDLARFRQRSPSTPKRRASTCTATASAWSSSRPGTAAPTSSRSRPAQTGAPNLAAAARRPAITKIFHYARFDIAVLFHAFGVMAEPVFCTKIASKLTRTYTDRHGLKDLVKDLLDIDLSKQQQSSDWAPTA